MLAGSCGLLPLCNGEAEGEEEEGWCGEGEEGEGGWGFLSGVDPTERDGTEESAACVCECVCVSVCVCVCVHALNFLPSFHFQKFQLDFQWATVAMTTNKLKM